MGRPVDPDDWTDFGRFLRDHGIRAGAAAKALGISRNFVHLLSTKRGNPPSMRLAVRIRRWTELLDRKSTVHESSWEVFFPDDENAAA